MACETGYIIERVETKLNTNLHGNNQEGDPVPARLLTSWLVTGISSTVNQRGQGPLPDLNNYSRRREKLSEEGFKLLQCWQSWPCTQGGTLHRSHSIS